MYQFYVNILKHTTRGGNAQEVDPSAAESVSEPLVHSENQPAFIISFGFTA